MRSGMCPCGGWLFESTHDVKSDSKASEWAATAVTAPVRVTQKRCEGCGRTRVVVRSGESVIAERG